MKKRILEYRERIDALLENDSENTDWQAVYSEHLTQISFFQHERLVHLIVTMTFAVLEMLSICAFVISQYLPILALSAAFLVLLVPYVMHYYLLENETQKMYDQYDEILKKCKNKTLSI